MQARPHAQLRQSLAQRLHPRLVRLSAPFALGVAHVDAVGRSVLRDHQQFLHPTAHDQAFGLAQHVVDGAGNQVAAHRGDDAEAATVVAAFGNLEVGIVLRRQLDADVVLRCATRQQVHERIVPGRQRPVHRAHHGAVVLRPADRQHVREPLANHLRALAETACDDDLAVLRHRLADRVQRFGHRRVDEAAGVDHHHVGIVVAGHEVIALDAELGEDAFGVDQRLGAAETDETDLGVGCGHGNGRKTGRATPPASRGANYSVG